MKRYALLVALAALSACAPRITIEPLVPGQPVEVHQYRERGAVVPGLPGIRLDTRKVGTAGPVSLPASFLTAGGDIASGGVVASAQSGTLSFSSTGQMSCISSDTTCQLQEARPVTDVPPHPVYLTGQAAYLTGSSNPTGGGACMMGGAGANVTTSTGGPATIAGGWSFATNETGGNVETILEAPAGTGTEAASVVYRAAQLTGTVSVTSTSTAITFSTAQTLAAGTPLVFSGQLSLVYHLSAAITASTSGVLTSPYGGTTTAGLAVWAGSAIIALGQAPGTSIDAIWFGSNASAPTSANATLRYNTGYAQLNGPTGISFLVNGAYEGLLQSGIAEFGSSGTGSAFGGTNVVVLDNGTSPTSSPTSGAVLTSVSGALTVTPTGNTTPALTVASTTTTIAGTLDAGYVAVTPVNGANTLTSAQSAVANLNLLAGATAAVTVTDALTPAAAKGAVLVVRNGTSQTVSFQWSTGTACTLATVTSAWVTSDGTNCIVMVHGT